MNFQRTYTNRIQIYWFTHHVRCFFYLRFQVNWQQTLWSFTTLKTRRKDLRDLCKLNVKTVNLSKAFTLHLRLTAEKSKLRRSKLGLYAVSKVSGLVMHHLLSCVVPWTCHHLSPKIHMMVYDLSVLSKGMAEKSISDACYR